MSDEHRIFRSDYQPPAFLISTCDLAFAIHSDKTHVRAITTHTRNPKHKPIEKPYNTYERTIHKPTHK
jgi:hypothetical protein